MVICLERGADLHMAHCHSLSLASVKSRLVLPFWYRLTPVVLNKGPLNGCVCVCVWHCLHNMWSRVNVTVGCPYICLFFRRLTAAVGLLPSTVWAGDIDRQRRALGVCKQWYGMVL